jgi:hypothetical protein
MAGRLAGRDGLPRVLGASPGDPQRSRAQTLLIVVALGAALSACTSTSTGSGQSPTAIAATSAPSIPPEQVAAEYVDAYAHFDRARLKSVLGGDALAQWRTTLSKFNRSDEAMEFTVLPGHCSPQPGSGTDTSVTCTFDMHGLGSERLELGPYTNNDFGIVVRDGKVVEAEMHFDYGNSGFAGQMWEPFVAWVTRRYPKDIPKMIDSNATPLPDATSIKLWHRHIGEYVASKSS